MATLEVGGHRDAGVREVMQACLADAGAAALLAALLRGQREVKPALAARPARPARGVSVARRRWALRYSLAPGAVVAQGAVSSSALAGAARSSHAGGTSTVCWRV